MKKRLLSWLLVLTMITSLIPSTLVTTAFAAADGVTLGVSVTEKTLSASDTSPYEINSSGTYRVTGSSTQPIIVTADAGEVILVLDGVNIQSTTSPIQLKKGTLSAAKVTLVVPDGKTATLSCTSTTKTAAESADVAGKTAGINVPDGTTLTIDKISGENGTGKLTISGGYGSAGIGGNYGYGYAGAGYGTSSHDTTVTDANKRPSLGFGGEGGTRNAPHKGFGGAPGRDGQSAEKSGTVNINACNISITSNAGAGIGGGQGATGESGFEGKQGYKVGDASWVNPAMGSGGGGAGGNGGRGGDCGPVTINGGMLDIKVTAPTAASGQKTADNIHQLTPKDKIRTVGIGGGPGGWGGFGAKGGDTAPANGHSPSSNYYESGFGGAGGYGETGYVNYGGAADAITINGGIITVQGVGIAMGSNINANDTRVQAAERSYIYNYNYNAGKGLQGGRGGGGGRARALTAAPINNAKISLNGGNISVSSVYDRWNENPETKENNQSVFSTAPTAQSNTDGLYPTVIIVKELSDKTNVSGAKITVPVQVTGGTTYTYNAMTDANGKAVLWLPEGNYTLQNNSVTHAIGSMPDGTSQTVNVSPDATTQTEVYIGSTFSLSLTPDTKVYDNPVSVKADMSKLQGTISQIRWFRVSATDTQMYEKNADVTANIKSFQTGYESVADADRALIQNPTLDNNTFSISADQNGRYWVEVTKTDGSRTDVIVRDITVTNIYRSYPIKVRSYIYEGDSNGQPILLQDTGYINPPDKAGMPTTQTYGFAWNLNGYNEQSPNGTNLLPSNVAPYDTLTLNARTANHTWYIAQVNGNAFADTANNEDFEPIELTLDGNFFQNRYCDSENNVKDPGKYTIRYSARDGALDVVTISGVIKDAASGTKPLYTHTRSYTDAIDNDSITAINWPEYKLVGVKVNNVDGKLDKDVDGKTTSSITITDIHGKKSGKQNKIQTVTFLYEYNMTDVTINAYYKGTTTPVEGLSSYKEKMEIDKEYTPTAPAVAGHDLAGSSLNDGKFTPTGKNDVITFYYTKSSGNVTYKAVDGEGNTLWTGSGKVAKGTVPNDVAPDYGITNMTKDDAVATKYTKADGSDYGNNNQFDGVNDMTVTYTYKHITRNVTVQKIDTTKSGTGAVIETETAKPYNVGSYQTIAPEKTPSGYEIVGDDSKTVYIEAGAGDLVVKFYYRPSATADVTIKLFEADASGNKVGTEPFQTMTVKVSYGQEQTINAPSITGWAVTGDTTKKVNLKNGETAPVIEFLYKPVYDTITVELKNKDGSENLPQDALPTGWKGSFQVQQGQSFTITAPSIVNYKLADGEAVQKTLTAEEIKSNNTTITFKYTKAEADLITITVKGVGANGNELYSYTKDVRKSAADVEIQIFTMNGYKLDKVEMDGTAVTATDGTYKISPNGAAKTVTATYSDNMTDVTIHGYYKGTTTKVFNDFTVKAEVGKAFTYTQPSLIGYDTVTPINNTIDAVKTGASITFYYQKSSGNVTYKAQDEKGKELAVKTVTVAKNGNIVSTTDKANELFSIPYYQVKNEGVVTTNAADKTKYDGVNDVTVTYTYEKIKKTVTIEKIDQATGNKIEGVTDQVTEALATGETHTVTLTKVEGYTSLDNGSVSIFVKNKDNQTVKVYYKQSTEAFITAKQVCNGVTLNTYQIPAQYGVETTIKAPTMQGYNAPADTKFTATKGGTNEVTLTYTLDAWTVTVKLMDQTGSEITLAGFAKTYQVKKGDSFSIAAPSINDYSLISNDLVVTRTAAELESEANRTIQFKYDKTENVDYVTHTIRGVDKDHSNTELFNYTVLVAKDAADADAVATYYAPTWANLTPATLVQTAKKNETKTVTFVYSSNLATVTVEHVGRNGKKLTEGGITDVTLDGYTVTGKATTIAAPALDGYVCVGAYNNSVQEGKLTQNVTLAAGSNTVKFVYEKIADSDVVFKLVDKDTNHIINYIKGVIGSTYAPAQTNNALNLSSIHYNFVADDRASDAFKPTGNASVAVANGMKGEYVVYYERESRTVTYKFMDVTGGEATATEIQNVTNGNETSARIGEAFKATAPVIDGYTVVGSATFNEVVEAGTDALEITFNYRQKDSKEVTVNHKVTDTNGETLFTYTVSASVGEWVSAKPHDFGGKYTLIGSDAEKKVQVTNGENKIEFFYAPNFVTVSAFTNTDGQNNQSYGTPVTAAKKTGETVKLNPPSLNGFVLSGIKVDNDGSETTYARGWDKNTNTLTLTLSDQSKDNIRVTYYYKEIKDVIPDYQANLTIKAQYNGVQLIADHTQVVTKGKDATVIPATRDGYTVKQYKLGENGQLTDVQEDEKLNGITVNVNADTTLIFTYDRADGSAVVPGEDDQLGTPDDVIIKPNGDNKPTVDSGTGNVTVPDGAEVVTPSGTVIPPDGSIVKPDGTIVAPGKDGTTNPGVTIDPSKPDSAAPTYLYVKYLPNGGKGEVPTQFFKKGDTITIAANTFKADNKTADGWNTQEDGKGVDYAAGANQLNASLTLFAKWAANNYAESVTITFHANLTGVQDEQQTIGFYNGTSATENLRANTFVLNGWTFGGWSKQQVGSIDFADKAAFTFKHDDDTTLNLYAQWYKQDGTSFTVPGKDGNPSNADTNVTGSGNGISRKPDTGVITILSGGTITVKNPTTGKTETITLPDGGKLNPDGSYSINLPNGGKIDVDKDGKEEIKGDDGTTKPDTEVITLTYEINNGENDVVVIKAVKGEESTAIANPFTYADHVFLNWMANINGTVEEIAASTPFTPQDDVTLYAQWAKKNAGDGSIELPGKDGILEEPHDKDNVIVTPDKPDGKVTPKPDGSVKVEDKDGTVTRPTDPNHPENGKEEIKVPVGTVVEPDGTIKLPDGTVIAPDKRIPNDVTPKDYFVVTYEPGDGSGDVIRQIVAKKDTNTTLLGGDTFTAPHGKIFAGWKTNDEIKQAGDPYEVTANVTFTAQFKKIQTGKAVVTFDFNGGTADGKTYETRTGDPGAKLGTLPNPTRGGYTFAGWNEQINENTLFGEENSTTTYTAQWTAKTYTIHYNGNGATGNVADQTHVFDTANAKLAQNSFTLADKVFLGWSVNKDATSAMFREGEEIGDALRAILTNLDKNSESELTLYAIWKDNQVTPSEAIAIFDFAGGKDANGNTSVRKTGAADAAITITAPTREGYTFAGWDKGEPKFGATGTVTVFTAQWTANKHEVTFGVGEDTKGEMNGDASVQVEHNGYVEANKIPTISAKTGYMFIGWSDGTSTYAADAIKNYKVTADVTFTAQYEENSKAVVIFDFNGGKDADGKNSVSMSGDANAAINNMAEPSRDGYTFAGWKNGETTSQNPTFGAAGSVTTYTAVWTADPDKTFKVNFVVDATKGDATGTTEFDVVSGNFLTEVPTVNAKDGYTFIGWSDGKNTYFTSGVKLYAITGKTTFTALFEKADNNNPNPPAKDTLTISGNTTAKRGDKVNFKALLNGNVTDNVTWTVTGGKAGTTISEAGVLTVGSLETNATILTITATSKSDSTLTASTVLVVVVDGGSSSGGGGSSSGGGGSSSGGGSSTVSSYTIKASAGSGGIISPSGNVSVARGKDQTFSINPVNGYRISDVIVDGKSIGTVSTYTFDNVKANHTIEVKFTKLNSIVADPETTGVAGWLQTREHIAYLGGYGNGLFGPNDNMTRTQAAQMFYNLLLKKDVDITVNFTDVSADAWYGKAVHTLASLGIIAGIGNNQFAPDRTITRAEFTVIAMRFANLSADVTNPFSDVSENDWFYSAVTSAVSYGWISGYSNGTFRPRATITRAEVATIVNRMLNRTADRNFVDGSAVTHFDDVPNTYWAYYNIMEATNAHTHTIDNDGVESWTKQK